jgi:hypothetical protein
MRRHVFIYFLSGSSSMPDLMYEDDGSCKKKKEGIRLPPSAKNAGSCDFTRPHISALFNSA